MDMFYLCKLLLVSLLDSLRVLTWCSDYIWCQSSRSSWSFFFRRPCYGPRIWDSWCIGRSLFWLRRGSLLFSCLSWTSRIRDLTGGCLAPALLWLSFLCLFAGFVDFVPCCRMLMRPLQLHFLRFFFPLIDSQDKLCSFESRHQGLVQGVGFSLLVGKPFTPLRFLWLSPQTPRI